MRPPTPVTRAPPVRRPRLDLGPIPNVVRSADAPSPPPPRHTRFSPHSVIPAPSLLVIPAPERESAPSALQPPSRALPFRRPRLDLGPIPNVVRSADAPSPPPPATPAAAPTPPHPLLSPLRHTHATPHLVIPAPSLPVIPAPSLPVIPAPSLPVIPAPERESARAPSNPRHARSPSVAPDLIWGPYGGRWRHEVPSGLRTGLAGCSGPPCREGGWVWAPDQVWGDGRKGAGTRGGGGLVTDSRSGAGMTEREGRGNDGVGGAGLGVGAGGGPRWTAWMAGGAGVVLGCGWHNLGAALRGMRGAALRDGLKGIDHVDHSGLARPCLPARCSLGCSIRLPAGAGRADRARGRNPYPPPPPQTRSSRAFPRGWN